ncbi:MAG: rRNA adenine N-6-methyltransferase family protein [Gaiellaceae bacterium]
MRTRELSQNFLRNRRTARRLVQLADALADELVVDLGAGTGVVTQAAEALGRRVLAIEKDDRLVRELRRRLGSHPRVEVHHGDLLSAPHPTEAFVIAANPPFAISTQLVRRWMTSGRLRSFAIVVERAFGMRIAGRFGTTKLSASLGAFFAMDLPVELRAAEFHPQPRVRVSILTGSRRDPPLIPWTKRRRYWLLVNYVFERGRRTLRRALADLDARGIERRVLDMELRDASVEVLADLFERLDRSLRPEAWERLSAYDRALPSKRRALT